MTSTKHYQKLKTAKRDAYPATNFRRPKSLFLWYRFKPHISEVKQDLGKMSDGFTMHEGLIKTEKCLSPSCPMVPLGLIYRSPLYPTYIHTLCIFKDQSIYSLISH